MKLNKRNNEYAESENKICSDAELSASNCKSKVNNKGYSALLCAAGLAVTAVILIFLMLFFPGKVNEIIPKRTGDYEISVLLSVEDGCGYRVLSPNPLIIRAGEDIEFDIEISEGYKASEEQQDGVVYDSENSKIKLERVLYPTEVQFNVRPLEIFEFDVSYNSLNGKVTSNVTPGELAEDTVITVTATSNAGKTFIGFSVGNTTANGGTTVSYAEKYTFKLTDNTKLYANYATEGAQVVIYDTNGGFVKDTTNTTIYTETVNSYYTCPNTLADRDYMEREGYVLYSYNTKADGSGDVYGLGWNVLMPEENVLKLYAQWAKETSASLFTYKKTGSFITITGYSGTEKVVVIPEEIDGYPVTTIGTGAFLNESFETLILNKNIRTIMANAIRKCDNFKELHIFDAVIVMSDQSVQQCGAFSKIYVNAVIAPRYINGRNGTYQIKFERLMTAQSPMIVVVAGSSSAYGLDSERLENKLGNTYNVVNYGTNAGTPATFYLEFISHFVGEGDIVLQAPEPRVDQWGTNEIDTTTWQIFEGAYNAFSYVDIRHYTKLFSSFASFNNSRMSMTERSYEDYTSETVNMYGDYIKYKPNRSDSYVASANSLNFSQVYLTADNITRLNRVHKLIGDTGAKVYLSFSPTNINALTSSSLTSQVQADYMKRAEALSYVDAVISTVGDYVMAGRYFYNSDLHLSTEGSQIRTDKLAEDILAQLAKEK